MTTTIEPILSFFEGLALIASPCILPVLPLVLSASVDGGRKRPFGIIIGFVLAFTVFALASRKLVAALGIDLDIIKKGSLFFLAFFALVLLSEKLSEKFSALTQRTANIGGSISTGNQDGLFSGIVIGALIGLIWTPCAGPILAAVLVQVIRQESDLASLFIIVPFAVGAGIPMLIIALTGRSAISKLGFFTRHAESVRKTFGIIILLAVAFIASGIDPQSFFGSSKQPVLSNSQEVTGLTDGLDKSYPAPDFTGIQTWLNSKPLTMAELKGKVVLIDFWTYSCINCVRTLPHITAWDKKYRDKGLVIIGISAPEFEFEKNADNVKSAVIKHNIQYPVALDNNLNTWSNFHNQYWPAHYLIDQQGQVVYTHFGEGNYDVTENNIRFLLGLTKETKNDQQGEEEISDNQSPETYLGYSRAERYAGAPPLHYDQKSSYIFPNAIPDNSWALQNTWTVKGEKITAQSNKAALRFNFSARKVFLVLGTAGNKPIKAFIRLNGKQIDSAAGHDVRQGVVTVDKHTIYELVDQESVKSGLLEIQSSEPGLEAYAFTFGS